MAAVDNVEARLRINDMAILSGGAWINVGIDARSVVVEVFPPSPACQGHQAGYRRMACYACGLPDAVFERVAARYSCGGLQRAAWLERTVPTTAITASMAGALCVSELLRLLHASDQGASGSLFGGYASDTAQRVFMDTVTPSVSRVQLAPTNATGACPGCGMQEPAQSILPRPSDVATLNRYLLEMPDQAVRFSDALVLGCTCQACGVSHDSHAKLASYLNARASELSDAAIQCPACQVLALHFEIRESLGVQDYLNHFSDQMPDCAWLNQGGRCIDLIPTQETMTMRGLTP